MNKLKTPLVARVLLAKEDLSAVALEQVSMDFKTSSGKVDKEAKAKASETYSMSLRRCLEVVEAREEALNNNR